MADLPRGTVVFLFTDVEGSTRLWEQHPRAMRAASERHFAILRQAVDAHAGRVFGTQGDGLCAAFATAPDALAAATNAQRRLAAEAWRETGPLGVRMALHAGAAEVENGTYVGACLNRLARLLAVAHGGQVLVSQACSDLARDALPEGVGLRDLGEQRLRDLARPERAYQLLHPALPADFPPLRSLDAIPNNLPAQATPFIGRGQQLKALRARLAREDVRLMTLTGPGGTGKTRLALQAAAESLDAFADGAFFVDLAPIADAVLVPSAIARALEVKDAVGRSPLEQLVERLRDRSALLLLDNFEHVASAAPSVADLLSACPRLKVMVTSRELLRLYGEHSFPVPPMALPDRRAAPTAQHLAQFESVHLFVARARAARPDFALTDQNARLVAELCHRLDGLPLAIELAAARLRVLPLAALLARLEDALQALPLLTGGPRDLPARQQTLRNTVAWSYDLLDPDERTLFRRLAVFRGCTFEAVEAVCCAPSTQPGTSSLAVPPLALDPFEGVASLIEKNLLRQEETADGAAWYVMLETIREYALERLAAPDVANPDEADAIHRRHVLYYLKLAEATGEPELYGARQSEWMARLEREHDNLRAALRWAEARGYAEPAFRLAVALWWFWGVHGHVNEGRERLAALLSRFPHRAASPRLAAIRARAVHAAGNLAAFQDDHGAARPLHEEALGAFREQGDMAGVETALEALGRVASLQGDHEAAWGYLQQTLELARGRGDPIAVGAVLLNLAHVAHRRGDLAAARSLVEEGIAVKRELGTPREMALHLINLGTLAADQGDRAAADAAFEQGLALARESGDQRTVALTLAEAGSSAVTRGDYATARELLRESLAMQEELGDPGGVAFVVERFASLAAAEARPALALRLAGAAAALRERVGVPLSLDARRGLDASLRLARSRLGERAASEASAAGRAMPHGEAIAEALRPEEPAAVPVDRARTLLSRREQEVAALIGRGYSNRQIAAELVITEGTAASHVVHILDKLGAGSRAQIAVWAARHGLVAEDNASAP